MTARRIVLIAMALAAALAILLGATPASAHDLRPGVLSLVEREGGAFDVAWVEPVDAAGSGGEVHIVYPAQCDARERTLVCRAPLEGAIAFEGLPTSRSKVVVTVRFRDGRTVDAVATGASPRVDIGPRGSSSFLRWIVIGTEHVFTGADHVAFVIGLFLVVGTRKKLLATITSFTVAHSLTLAMATLGVVRLPSGPVEAAIAASVVLVAKEATSSEPTLSRRQPWLVAFLFGLVHGLGFAGALGELPLPKDALGTTLVAFNVGVEIAQLVVVGALAFVTWISARAALTPVVRARVKLSTCYAIGALGAFWFFDRAYFVLNR